MSRDLLSAHKYLTSININLNQPSESSLLLLHMKCCLPKRSFLSCKSTFMGESRDKTLPVAWSFMAPFFPFSGTCHLLEEYNHFPFWFSNLPSLVSLQSWPIKSCSFSCMKQMLICGYDTKHFPYSPWIISFFLAKTIFSIFGVPVLKTFLTISLLIGR